MHSHFPLFIFYIYSYFYIIINHHSFLLYFIFIVIFISYLFYFAPLCSFSPARGALHHLPEPHRDGRQRGGDRRTLKLGVLPAPRLPPRPDPRPTHRRRRRGKRPRARRDPKKGKKGKRSQLHSLNPEIYNLRSTLSYHNKNKNKILK